MTAVTCVCGRLCASRSGHATHARSCAREKDRRAAYFRAMNADDWTDYERTYGRYHLLHGSEFRR